MGCSRDGLLIKRSSIRISGSYSVLLIRTVLPSSASATPLFASKKGFASLQAIAPHWLTARTIDGRTLATNILGDLLVKINS